MKKKKPTNPPTISGCTFQAVKWDEAATESVRILAGAIKMNAEAALSLADVFKASNVHIDAMVRIEQAK